LKIKTKVKRIYADEITKMLKNRNSKNVWNGVNILCGKKSNQSQILELKDPTTGEETSDPRLCAQILANAFKTKVENLLKQTGETNPMTDKIDRKFEEESSPIRFEVTEIIKVLHDSKNSSSEGPDGISIKYLKDAAEELSPILKFLFEKAALLAKTPNQWKMAKVVPIFKKGEKLNPDNYRPISLLCSTSKVYERLILGIMSRAYGHIIPSHFQHGFRRNHSTTTATLTMQNRIARLIDNNKKVILVSTDMSSAFDLLDKDILLPTYDQAWYIPKPCGHL